MDQVVDGSKSIHRRKRVQEKNHEYLVELNSNAASCVWGQVHPKFLRHGEKARIIIKSREMVIGQLTRGHV